MENLVKNSYYYFRVFAENAIGLSQPLETEQAIEAKPAFGPPGKPIGPLVISNIQTNGCTLAWAPPSEDGGSRIVSYIIEAREAKRATWYQLDSIDASETKFKVGDLVENNSYYFRVLAKNTIGVSDALESDTPVTIKRPAGVPDTPVPLLVSDIQSDNCTLEWKAPSWTGGEELKGYLIEMRVGDSKEWKKVADAEPYSKNYQVKNLSEGNEYYFRISAYNNMGSSKPLELNRPVVPKKKLTAPSAPTGPITPLKCNKDSISIQWGPPKDDGGAPLTRYAIYYRETNKQNWSRSGVVDPETFSYQVENLTENSDYHFRIVAENHIGQSEHLQTQEPIKARSPYNVPDKPEGPLLVSNVTANSASVAWKRPLSDGGSPITGYLIKRRDINRPVWVKCGRVNADTFKANIRDLVEGCQYAVQIFAENSEGLSASLDSDEPITPKRPRGPPEAPASFECIGVDLHEITIQWEAPLSDGGALVKSYKLEMCEKGRKATSESRNWSTIREELGSIHTSYCVRDLKEGHEYLFRISATNELGTSEPKVLDKPVMPRKMVEPPSTPTGPLKIVSMGENNITVGWGESKNDGGSPISNYVIEIRDVLKASWNTVGSVNPYTSQFKITDLAENGNYFIRIRAQNDANLTSQPLETESAVFLKSPYNPPSSPKELKLVSAGKDKVTLEFKGSESDGGMPIRHYLIEKRDSNRVTWVKAAKVKPKEAEETSATYTCEIDELNPGASYWFRVVAENPKGKSETCEITAVVKLEKELEKPSKPLDFNVIRQKKPSSVLLEWKAPLYDGNDKLNEYVIEQWCSNSKEWKVLTTSAPNETTHMVNNLSEGLTYKFRIIASNKVGQSEPSLETVDVKVQKNITVPSQPIGPLKYTITEDNTVITLNWSPPKSNGGSKIKRYIVEKKQLGTSMSSEWFKIGFTGADDTQYKMAEYFIEDSTFSFRIYAENEAGKSTPLELSSPIVIERKKRIPEKPAYLRVKEKTIDSVTIAWKSFAVNSYSQADKFIVEKRDKNALEWTRAGHTKNEIFTVTDLAINSAYYFRVIAVNDAGESEPAEIAELVSTDISNELPSKPLSLSVDEITESSVTLIWISPKNSGAKPIIGYKIYKLASINTHWQEVDQISKAKKLTYTVTELDYNYDYKFKVCAYSELGLGKPNETDKVQLRKPVTPPSEPVNLFVKSVNDGQLSISWMSPSKTGGSPITGYVIERSEIVSSLLKPEDRTKEDSYVVTSKWVRHDTVDRYTLDYKLKNLTVGGMYSIRVAAENLAGIGDYAEIEEPVVAKNLFSKPDAPTGPILLTNMTRETVDASWHAPKHNGGSPITSYFVEKRDIKENIWIKIARIDPDIRTLRIFNLVEGNEYELRVCAENEHGMSEPLVSEKFKPLRLYGNLVFLYFEL
jgi:titin